MIMPEQWQGRVSMFKSDFQKWFESQPKWTQEWMKKQPVWHDRDLWLFFAYGGILGFVVGLLFGVSL